MKLSAKQLFILLWCWQNKRSPDTARRLSHVSYTTVARWYQRFREQVPEAPTTLKGLVQIDESYFGKLRSRQPQLIVAGAIEPDTRKVMLRVTNSRSQDALESFVVDHVELGTLVVSDNGTPTKNFHYSAMAMSLGTTALASLQAQTKLRVSGVA